MTTRSIQEIRSPGGGDGIRGFWDVTPTPVGGSNPNLIDSNYDTDYAGGIFTPGFTGAGGGWAASVASFSGSHTLNAAFAKRFGLRAAIANIATNAAADTFYIGIGFAPNGKSAAQIEAAVVQVLQSNNPVGFDVLAIMGVGPAGAFATLYSADDGIATIDFATFAFDTLADELAGYVSATNDGVNLRAAAAIETINAPRNLDATGIDLASASIVDTANATDLSPFVFCASNGARPGANAAVAVDWLLGTSTVSVAGTDFVTVSGGTQGGWDAVHDAPIAAIGTPPGGYTQAVLPVGATANHQYRAYVNPTFGGAADEIHPYGVILRNGDVILVDDTTTGDERISVIERRGDDPDDVIYVTGNTSASDAWHGKQIVVTAAAQINVPSTVAVGLQFDVMRDTAGAVTLVSAHTLKTTVGAGPTITITDQNGWCSVLKISGTAVSIVGQIS